MFSLSQCNRSYHFRAQSFTKIGICYKYIFIHRPTAAHNSMLNRLEDEAFSLKPSNCDLHKRREILLQILS